MKLTAAMDDLGDNLGPEEPKSRSKKAVAIAAPKRKSKKAVAVAAPKNNRICIMLDDNEDIPPTGHPVSVNGKMYILKTNEKMWVPPEVIEVLENAVTSVPVFGQGQKVLGYRDRPRLPFRVFPNEVRP